MSHEPQNVKISVIIPVYNAEWCLRRCLDSVCRQTLRELEIICVDDGSTDASLSLLNEYAEGDARFVVHRQENLNASVARNWALSVAHGQYVAFMDADDAYAGEDVLSRLYKIANEDGLKAAGGAFVPFSESPGDQGWEPRYPMTGKAGILNYADAPFDYGYQMFIFDRRMLVDKGICFPDRLRYQDPPFMVRAMAAAGRFRDDGPLVYLYRWGHQKIDWRARDYGKMRGVLAGMSDVVNFARGNGLEPLIDSTWRRFVRDYAKAFLSSDIPVEQLDEYRSFEAALPAREAEELRNMRCRALEATTLQAHSEGAIPGPEPAVTVILPSLNVARYARACMESVMGQTLSDIEIICVDAGSTDGTLEIWNEYAQKDVRITVVVSERRSYGYQMNLGLARARGEYIGIVEPDDYVSADMFESLYAAAKQNDLDFVKSDLIRFVTVGGVEKNQYCPLTSETRRYGRVLSPRHDPELLRLTLNNPTGIYRRSFVQGKGIVFNETPGASYQDVGFWLQTFLLSDRALFLKKAFYHYRGDNEQSSVHSRGKVYCINAEYAFAFAWLSRHPELQAQFTPWLYWAKFASYNFALTRLSDDYLLDYVLLMYGSFKDAECAGLVDRSLFNSYQRGRYEQLMADPIRFGLSLMTPAAARAAAQRHFGSCAQSGAGVGAPGPSAQKPPLFLRALKCWRENGFSYTLRRIVLGKAPHAS